MGFSSKIAGNRKKLEIEEAFYPDFISSPDRIKRGEVYEKEWKRLDAGNFHLHGGLQDLKLLLKESKGEGLEVKGAQVTLVRII